MNISILYILTRNELTHLVIWLAWCMSPLLNYCKTYSKEAGGRQDNCSLGTSRENSLALIFFSFSKESRGEVIKRIQSSLFLSLIHPTTLLVPGCPMWLISLAKESVPLQLKAGQPRKGQLMWGVNNLKIPEGLLCSSGGCFSFESVTHHNFLYYKKKIK